MPVASALRSPNTAAVCRALLLLMLAAAGVPARAAAGPPDFSGTWQLDAGRSDNARARVEEAAGPAQVKGGGTNPLTILPPMGMKGSVERVELRDYLLRLVTQMDRLEITQAPNEIKLVHGEDLVRTFYFDREHVRMDGQGRKLKCKTKWVGQQLVLDEQGDKGRKIREGLTLDPATRALIQEVHLEDRLLKKPIDLRLVYIRAH